MTKINSELEAELMEGMRAYLESLPKAASTADITAELAKIADDLDSAGLVTQANQADSILTEFARLQQNFQG
jgi:hypothetical protein